MEQQSGRDRPHERTVVVTGANGLVGRSVTRAFLDAGWSVRAVVRGAERTLAPGVERFLIANYLEDDWGPVMAGVDAVVHLVGYTHSRSSADDEAARYQQVNVELTARVAQAAASVRHFVYMSSVKAAGEESSAPLRETDPPRPEDEYGKSKLRAEQLVMAHFEATDTIPIIHRPPLVYGPGVEANFARLMRAVDRGLPLPLGSVENRRSMIYVENLANAVVHSTDLTEPATYFVADGETRSTPELLRELGRHLDKPARILPFPSGLLRGLARATGNGQQIRKLIGSLEVSTAALRQTGWEPPFSADEGLAATVTAYRESSHS